MTVNFLVPFSFYFPLCLSLLVRSISSHGLPSVTLCHHLWPSGLASWSALSHYSAKFASSQVWAFSLVYECVCSEVPVYYFLQYNIRGQMLEQWGTISDCTNTHYSKQVPQGIWVSSVPSSITVSCSLQQFRLCTQFLDACYCCLVSSQWEPRQISKTTFNQKKWNAFEVTKLFQAQEKKNEKHSVSPPKVITLPVIVAKEKMSLSERALLCLYPQLKMSETDFMGLY